MLPITFYGNQKQPLTGPLERWDVLALSTRFGLLDCGNQIEFCGLLDVHKVLPSKAAKVS